MKKHLLVLCAIFTGTLLPAQAQDSNISKDVETDEVVVTGTRNGTDIRHLPMTITTVNRLKLTESNRSSILPTLTEQVPSLFVTSRGVMGYGVSGGAAGGINLRGISAGSGQLMVLIDGHPQYMGIFGHPIADVYQSFMSEKVEVLRGPASVLYGSNAMGGVINIVTRKMLEDGIKTDFNVGYGSYNTLQTEATNRVKAGKFNSILSLSYNRTDGHRARMAFEQYGGYAKVGYSFTENWKAYADLNLTHFKATNPGTIQAPILEGDQWVTRGAASAVIENNFDKTSGALSLFYNWGHHKINDGYTPGPESGPQKNFYLSDDSMMGFSWYQSVRLFEGNRLTGGIDFQHIKGHAWNESRTTGEVTNTYANKSLNEIAGYVDFRQDITSWLTVDAGLRVDHHSQAGTELIPQGGLSFRLPKDAQIKAMISKGFRNPSIREMYMFPPQNDKLKPERLMNYELSFTKREFDGALTYGANLYYLKADNIIQTQRVEGKPRNLNTGEIENWGIEANANYRINEKWSVNANGSYLHMKKPVLGAPKNKFFAGVNYRHNRWAFNTGIQYINDLYTAVGENPTKESFVLWNADVNYKLASFATLYVKGENLLAQRYEINAGFPMPKATVMGGIHLTF
ncbi:MAG: TonB-dependent receptor [Bacteroidaceae bacterium]|nr:TonB-dependent receptor [Bacteroidaceae bacterium]